MSYNTESYTASNHKEWEKAGLKDYGDFSDCVEYVNQEDDYCDSLRGEWWYADDETTTIYSGTFGNYNSPGASQYTYAEVFCDADEYKAAVAEWEAKPEYLEHEDDCECESCKEDREDEEESEEDEEELDEDKKPV